MTDKEKTPIEKKEEHVHGAHGHSHEHVHEHKHEDHKHEDKKETDKKTETKKVVKERPKKKEAVVNASNLPISTKHSMAICKFIKNKKIEDAIKELEAVAKLRQAVPMRGEIPHRKGKMMSGRFPKKAAQNFIVLLKSLKANSDYNGIEDAVIVEAFANIGSRPYGRFGAYRKKRTHLKIVAKSRKVKNKEQAK